MICSCYHHVNIIFTGSDRRGERPDADVRAAEPLRRHRHEGGPDKEDLGPPPVPRHNLQEVQKVFLIWDTEKSFTFVSQVHQCLSTRLNFPPFSLPLT